MEKQLALKILNLPDHATSELITRNYRELVTDLRQRISDAPPHLRQEFERSLQQAENAYQVLMSALPKPEWLPTADRVAVPVQAPTQNNIPVFQSTSASPAQNLDFMQRNSKWFFGAMVLSFALAVFLGIQYSKANKELAVAKPLAEKSKKLEPILTNSRFNLKNMGKDPISLEKFEVYYIKDDSLVVYTPNENTQPKCPAEIGPGESYSPYEYKGAKKIYDGEVLFYHLLLYSSDGTPISIAKHCDPQTDFIPIQINAK